LVSFKLLYNDFIDLIKPGYILVKVNYFSY